MRNAGIALTLVGIALSTTGVALGYNAAFEVAFGGQRPSEQYDEDISLCLVAGLAGIVGGVTVWAIGQHRLNAVQRVTIAPFASARSGGVAARISF